MTSLSHGTSSLVGRQREREQRGAWHQHVVMASAEPAAIVAPTLESAAAEAAAAEAATTEAASEGESADEENTDDEAPADEEGAEEGGEESTPAAETTESA